MKIGVLGAGQLGRMLALAGLPLGFEFRFFDPSPDACAAVLGEHVCADYADEGALARFCEGLEVATFEFENVPVNTAAFVDGRVPLFPKPSALTAAQDRLAEKRLFQELGIAVPPFLAVDTREQLDQAAKRIGLPMVLKTRRMGYDGKGQARIRGAGELDAAWRALGGQPLIAETWVDFTREVSCLGVRRRTGAMAFYPLVENVHRHGILHRSTPRVGDVLQAQAESHVRAVMERLDYVGVLAFEFFVSRDGVLLGNEIAPRVHNSGHWTIEGARTSQFANHLRAVVDLPLGNTAAVAPVSMLNLVGRAPLLPDLLAIEGAQVHLYGKAPKPLRKIGHVNLFATDAAALETRVRTIESMLD